MTDLPVRHFRSSDGVTLAYREIGTGRPLLLIHGFMADARQWLRHGVAEAFAARGYRVVLPDLRGHGESDRPHDAAAYPPDVLAADCLALVESLGIDGQGGGYDLAGYSLGGRTVLRMLVRGARPGHAVVAGQGWDVTSRSTSRTPRFRDLLTALADPDAATPDGARHWIAEAGGDPVALRHVLDTHVDTPPEALRRITTPTLVLVGAEDDERASADELAAALPAARFVRVPGNHGSAPAGPEFRTVVTEFLADRAAGAAV